MSRKLVLASCSPRRRKLMEEAGLDFRAEPPRIAERPPRRGESAESHALSLARAKAAEVAARLASADPARPGGALETGDIVLAADTVVAHEGQILGQPANDAEARAMLRRLSGSAHAVVTAVVVLEFGTSRTRETIERTELVMSPITDEEIDSYVATGEGRGKAGAYAIQETGDRYVRIVSGSRTNVVGLPMERLTEMLGEFGFEGPGRPAPGRADNAVDPPGRTS